MPIVVFYLAGKLVIASYVLSITHGAVCDGKGEPEVCSAIDEIGE